MPTYEYRCQACAHRFEEFQSITAAPIERCPKCGGPVRRLIGAGAGIVFRGSGFYATDYRSKEYRAKAKAETSGGNGASSKAGEKSPTSSLTAAKSEAKAAPEK